jgi:hypothetical protein
MAEVAEAAATGVPATDETEGTAEIEETDLLVNR